MAVGIAGILLAFFGITAILAVIKRIQQTITRISLDHRAISEHTAKAVSESISTAISAALAPPEPTPYAAEMERVAAIVRSYTNQPPAWNAPSDSPASTEQSFEPHSGSVDEPWTPDPHDDLFPDNERPPSAIISPDSDLIDIVTGKA